jgi:NitT/TauT family transport system substrate-binding protein
MPYCIALLLRWSRALACVAACLAAHAEQPLRFAVAQLPLSLPVFVAQDRGFFAAERLALQLVDCDFGKQCLERLLGGQADLATAADAPLALALAGLRGERFALLATLGTLRSDSKVITHAGSGISTMKDLVGRRVGTTVGTSAQYSLDLGLLSADVDPALVTVVPIEPADAGAALADHRVDAVSAFEPYAYQAARALGAKAVVLRAVHFHAATWNLVASRPRQPELQAMCRALDRAIRFIREHPDTARAILRARLRYDDAAIAWLWPDMSFRLELRQSLLSTLESQARWALRRGHASGRLPDFLDYIETAPLSAVRADAVGIVR